MTRASAIVLIALTLIPLSRVDGGTQELDSNQDGVQPSEIGHGSLLLATADGRFRRAPNQATDVEIVVRGLLTEATVTQRFTNPGNDWVEGVYVFPLPTNTAVHAMRLQVGDRIIEAQVRERAEAKRTYEKAKRQGKKASLVEQERPNIFTTSVANIGPGEEVVVEIRYQEILDFDAGRFELRFPMVVGPRFIPGCPSNATKNGSGWAFDTDQVPDASRISPPVLHPSKGPINPVTLRVRVDAGMKIKSVSCLSHDVEIQRRRRSFDVMLDGVPADRDFVLEWRPKRGAKPRAAVFTEEFDGWVYVLAMLMPPADDRAVSFKLHPFSSLHLSDPIPQS